MQCVTRESVFQLKRELDEELRDTKELLPSQLSQQHGLLTGLIVMSEMRQEKAKKKIPTLQYRLCKLVGIYLGQSKEELHGFIKELGIIEGERFSSQVKGLVEARKEIRAFGNAERSDEDLGSLSGMLLNIGLTAQALKAGRGEGTLSESDRSTLREQVEPTRQGFKRYIKPLYRICAFVLENFPENPNEVIEDLIDGNPARTPLKTLAAIKIEKLKICGPEIYQFYRNVAKDFRVHKQGPEFRKSLQALADRIKMVDPHSKRIEMCKSFGKSWAEELEGMV